MAEGNYEEVLRNNLGKIDLFESGSCKVVHDNAESSESTEFNLNQETTISSGSDNPEPVESFWFSYRERRWDTSKLRKWSHKKSIFFWTEQVEICDYQNCNISLARSYDKKLKIVIRRREEVKSDFMDKWVKVRRMIVFDLEKIYKSKTDTYTAREKAACIIFLRILLLSRNHRVSYWSLHLFSTSLLTVRSESIPNTQN